MNDLLKRRKELDAEFEEIMEMEDDAINVKSNMTISAVAKLIKILDEHITDAAEIATNQKYFDENQTTVLKETISELKDAFSQLQPPQIKVEAAKINIDFKLLADKIGSSNDVIIQLLNKYISSSTNGRNDGLYQLITSIAERQMQLLDKTFEQFNYAENLKGIENALTNIKPTPKQTEWKARVTEYSRDGRIEEMTIKAVK